VLIHECARLPYTPRSHGTVIEFLESSALTLYRQSPVDLYVYMFTVTDRTSAFVFSNYYCNLFLYLSEILVVVINSSFWICVASERGLGLLF